ncbi:MAG: dephospho-CoA kinase [Actinomycetota bacterium]
MLVVGLTGGIGAGKSTFAALLAEEGARVIDADALGREALQVGRPAWHSVVDQFGDEILAAGSMDIDRKRLAAIVFGDPKKLAALNAIVHPVIFKGIAERLEELRGTDEIVVLDAALIVEAGLDDVLDVIVVVDTNKEARRDRLVRERGMMPNQIDARMASQVSREKLLERADIVVRNDGTLEELARDARRVWKELIVRQ